MSSLLRLKRQQEHFFKSFWSLHITLSFLFIWSWNDKYVHRIPQFPRKPYTIPDQDGQTLYPFSNRNGTKNIPFGAAAYLYGLKKGVFSSPRPPQFLMAEDSWVSLGWMGGGGGGLAANGQESAIMTNWPNNSSIKWIIKFDAKAFHTQLITKVPAKKETGKIFLVCFFVNAARVEFNDA